MKIGIFSDLHLEFGDWNFTDFQDDVLYINTGDTHPDPKFRKMLVDKIKNGYHIMGNHDYYGATFVGAESHFDSLITNGIKIAGAPLWTDLTNPEDWWRYQTGLIDYRLTGNMNHNAYMNAHDFHKKFLLTSGADVIVSHHAPGYLSVADRYKGDAYNCCFATELHNDIVAMSQSHDGLGRIPWFAANVFLSLKISGCV